MVSTHSRPKAAGSFFKAIGKCPLCFNTQPPEGGWDQPSTLCGYPVYVSTHSRPKAAG